MTQQEAIEQIDRMIEFENKCRPNSKRIEALEMAKLALEKTVTKSVVLEGDGYDDNL